MRGISRLACGWQLAHYQPGQPLHKLNAMLLYPPQREENRFFCASSCVKGADGDDLVVSDAIGVVRDETRQLVDKRHKAQYISIKPQKGGRNKEVQFLT